MTKFCPNCFNEVEANSNDCQRCNADFSDPQGWKPTSEPGTWRPKKTGLGVLMQVLGRLVIGGIGWFAFMLVAMLAGFLSGSSTGISMANVFGICVLLWVVYPIFDLESKE